MTAWGSTEVRELVSEAKAVQPLALSCHIAGTDDEVAAELVRAMQVLAGDGWVADLTPEQLRPPVCFNLVRGDEAIGVAVAEPPPSQLVREPLQYQLSVTGRVRVDDLARHMFLRLPFTATEIRRIAANMPLTSSATRNLHRWVPGLAPDNTRPLSGFGAIFTIHHQTDFLILLQQAMQLGLDRRLVTVVDKEYQYLHSTRVDAYIMTRLGLPVFRYRQLVEGLEHHIRRVTAVRDEEAARTWRKTLIIDDGGYVLPILRQKFQPFLGLFRGAVEQTISGIWRVAPYMPLELPLFSVAESDLKEAVEAQGVAMAGIANFRRLVPHEKFDGRRALVVGSGRIGKAVARYLGSLNVRVTVVETDVGEVARAKQLGMDVFTSITKAIEHSRPRYVICCAGPAGVSGEALAYLKGPCYLVSLTSRDTAFDKKWLEATCTQRPYGTVGTVYSHLVDGQKQDLFLVADGYPVNFHFAESMPNQQSDLVMASLLVGAVTLAVNDPVWPPGNDPRRANDVLNAGGLLEDFIALDDGSGPDLCW